VMRLKPAAKRQSALTWSQIMYVKQYLKSTIYIGILTIGSGLAAAQASDAFIPKLINSSTVPSN
jgi:hypothetical protein